MLSLTKRKDPSPAPGSADESESVAVARTRARRRLVGAAMLVGIGIIGFPLLFETQPRPIAVDIPIEIPPKDGAAAPVLPAPKQTGAATRVARQAQVKPVEPTAEIVDNTSEASSAPPKPAATAAARPPAPAASAVALPAAAASAPAEARTERNAAEAQRAQDLLDGKTDAAASAAKAPRFVVQAGAYTDPAALREARQKVEKLGLKTYTQVIESESGPRTRVRVGPFATRDEAERAAARIKSAGLAANIVVL